MLPDRKQLLFISDEELEELKPLKLIFLDIDGVLNGYTKRIRFVCKLAEFFGLRKVFIHCYDIFGIRPYRVFLLSRICKKTGAKVVISSSWRFGYVNSPPDGGVDKRVRKLKKWLRRFHVDVIGVTPDLYRSPASERREREIRVFMVLVEWGLHPGDQFVVLDDERYGLEGFEEGKELIKTGDGENAGLTWKQMNQAIQILQR
jgi:hypothetical protein